MLAMDADAQKANLHNYLKHERAAVLAKLADRMTFAPG